MRVFVTSTLLDDESHLLDDDNDALKLLDDESHLLDDDDDALN